MVLAGDTDLPPVAADDDDCELLRSQVQNLTVALQSARRIGAAIGILMTTHKITEDRAFALLVGASQASNRKVRDIAEDVVQTGVLA